MAKRPPRPHEGGAKAEVLYLLAVALRPPSDRESLGECLARLRERLGPGIPGDSREALDRLASLKRPEQEYHRLFLGPTRPIAPPFESVYHEGQVYGASTMEFLQELREAGLEPADAFWLPPDHVAVQLEYLAFLEDRTQEVRSGGSAAAESSWVEKARRFRETHLFRWLPAFLSCLEAGAPRSPYTGLVGLTIDVLGVPRVRPQGKEAD